MRRGRSTIPILYKAAGWNSFTQAGQITAQKLYQTKQGSGGGDSNRYYVHTLADWSSVIPAL